MSTVVSPPASPCSTVLPVPSLDPSSTTYTIAPGTARCARETTSAIVAEAWYAGMTTATAASARPGIGRGVPVEDGEDRLELGAQILHRLGGERAPRLRLELPASAVLLDLLARALDRVLLRVQQVLHKHDQLDLAPLVHPVPRAVLGRVQEPELALPVAQHVRLQIGELAHLADREELLYRMRMREAHRQCSGFSSRSIRSATAWLGGFPLNSTSATSRAIGNSTPCRSPRVTAERAVFTPSATVARPASASSSRLPRPSSIPS